MCARMRSPPRYSRIHLCTRMICGHMDRRDSAKDHRATKHYKATSSLITQAIEKEPDRVRRQVDTRI